MAQNQNIIYQIPPFPLKFHQIHEPKNKAFSPISSHLINTTQKRLLFYDNHDVSAARLIPKDTSTSLKQHYQTEKRFLTIETPQKKTQTKKPS